MFGLAVAFCRAFHTVAGSQRCTYALFCRLFQGTCTVSAACVVMFLLRPYAQSNGTPNRFYGDNELSGGTKHNSQSDICNIFRYGHNGSKPRYKLCFYYRSVRFGALYVRPQADDIYAKRQILSPNIVPSYVQRLVGGRIGAFVCHQYIDNQ